MKKSFSVAILIFMLFFTYNIRSQVTIYPPHCDTLLWSKVINAISYRAQVADSSFNIIYTVISPDTQYVLPLGVLVGGNTYNMRIKPFFPADSGIWSGFYNFLFTAHPPPPVFLGLVDTSLPTSKLVWSKVPVAVSYRLQIAMDINFTIIALDTDNILDTFYTIQRSQWGTATYYLKLRSINSCGSGFWSLVYQITIHHYFGVKKISIEIPNKFELYQNYPNPFNPKTKIRFSIPEVRDQMSEVRLVVCNILGREVETLVNDKLSPGIYEVEWDGTNYSSGVYFYKLTASEFIETRKLVLLK